MCVFQLYTRSNHCNLQADQQCYKFYQSVTIYMLHTGGPNVLSLLPLNLNHTRVSGEIFISSATLHSVNLNLQSYAEECHCFCI